MKINEKPYVKRGILKLTSSGSIFYDLISKRHTICNKDLTNILIRCDGKKTIGNIAENVGEGRKDTLEKVVSVIEKLNEKNLVKTSVKDKKSNMRIIDKNRSRYPLDSVFLEATKRCNLNCVHCYNPQTSIQELETEEIYRAISDIRGLGALKIRITGGEPFMRKDLLDIIDKIHSSMIDFSIFTNGRLIKKEHIKELSFYNPEFIAVSIDSINANEYRSIRNSDNKKVLDNLEKMLNEGIRTRANIVLFKGINDSYQSIRNTLDYLKNLGMEKNDISFDEVVPEGRGGKIPIYNSREKVEIMIKISELYKKVFGADLLIKTSEGQKRRINSYCGLGESFFYLGSDGTVSLCPMLNFGEYIIGNVHQKALNDIWENSSLLNYFRRNEHIKDSECENCQALDICAGGCKAKSLFFNGFINAPDPWMCSYFFKD